MLNFSWRRKFTRLKSWKIMEKKKRIFFHLTIWSLYIKMFFIKSNIHRVNSRLLQYYIYMFIFSLCNIRLFIFIFILYIPRVYCNTVLIQTFNTHWHRIVFNRWSLYIHSFFFVYFYFYYHQKQFWASFLALDSYMYFHQQFSIDRYIFSLDSQRVTSHPPAIELVVWMFLAGHVRQKEHIQLFVTALFFRVIQSQIKSVPIYSARIEGIETANRVSIQKVHRAKE